MIDHDHKLETAAAIAGILYCLIAIGFLITEMFHG
jgi:hypothetical protein